MISRSIRRYLLSFCITFGHSVLSTRQIIWRIQFILSKFFNFVPALPRLDCRVRISCFFGQQDSRPGYVYQSYPWSLKCRTIIRRRLISDRSTDCSLILLRFRHRSKGHHAPTYPGVNLIGQCWLAVGCRQRSPGTFATRPCARRRLDAISDETCEKEPAAVILGLFDNSN